MITFHFHTFQATKKRQSELKGKFPADDFQNSLFNHCGSRWRKRRYDKNCLLSCIFCHPCYKFMTSFPFFELYVAHLLDLRLFSRAFHFPVISLLWSWFFRHASYARDYDLSHFKVWTYRDKNLLFWELLVWNGKLQKTNRLQFLDDKVDQNVLFPLQAGICHW